MIKVIVRLILVSSSTFFIIEPSRLLNETTPINSNKIDQIYVKWCLLTKSKHWPNSGYNLIQLFNAQSSTCKVITLLPFAITSNVRSKTQVAAALMYLEHLGVNISKYCSIINNVIANLMVFHDDTCHVNKPSLESFLVKIFDSLMPLEQIAGTIDNAIDNSEQFRRTMQQLQSSECRDIINKALSLQDVKKFLKILDNLGVDVHGYLQIVGNICGWGDF